jgi:hypothetical protein
VPPFGDYSINNFSKSTVYKYIQQTPGQYTKARTKRGRVLPPMHGRTLARSEILPSGNILGGDSMADHTKKDFTINAGHKNRLPSGKDNRFVNRTGCAYHGYLFTVLKILLGAAWTCQDQSMSVGSNSKTTMTKAGSLKCR